MQTASVKRERRRARAGRKREAVCYLSPAKPDEPSPTLQARVNHGIAADLRDATDPRCATVIGRLERAGKITANQSAAAAQYNSLHRQWCAVFGVPLTSDKTGSGRASEDFTIEEKQRIVRQWDEARAALRDAGQSVLEAVEYAVLWDDARGSEGMVSGGLAELCVHFGFQGGS